MEATKNTAPVAAKATDKKDDAAFKAAKAEAAKRFKEKKAKEAEDNKKFAAYMIKTAQDAKVYDKLSQECKDWLNKLANPTTARSAGNGTGSLFKSIFGDDAKVGTTVSLMDIFKKTFKSKADIDRYVKQWAEKGTIVEFKAAPNMIESTYTIKALGNN